MALLSAILIEGGYVTSRYERGQRPVIFAGSGIRRVAFKGYSFNGGADRTLSAASYDVHLDWEPYASGVRQADGRGVFDLDLDALAEGWHWLDIIAPGTGENAVPLPFYVRKGARAEPQLLMPVLTHSHAMVQPTVTQQEELVLRIPAAEAGAIHFGMVPARFAPTAVPLLPRQCPPFVGSSTDPSKIDPARELAMTAIVPVRDHDVHRATITADGVMTTSGAEPYDYSAVIAKTPVWALLDGPRGVGTVTCPMHLQIGRNGKAYAMEPWRAVRVAADGYVTTLFGWRHKTPPSNWQSPQDLELVGDWSAVPPSRHGMHEAWGFAWDERTTLENTAAAVIPAEGNERPHLVGDWFAGPVLYVADTQQNRILRVEFDGARHATPAKVTEHIGGLSDPWDVVYYRGELFVSERTAHRIAVYDAKTGAFLRVFAQGAALGYVDFNRKPRLNAGVTLAQARAQDVVLPEGLYVLNGKLYSGSLAQRAISVFDIESTGPRPALLAFYPLDGMLDGNSFFVKLAVSDGTFYEEGTMFVDHWSVGRHGAPNVIRPDGVQLPLLPGRVGLGTHWQSGGYATACAVKDGRVLFGFVQEGLLQISKALPTDQPMPAAVPAGALDYWRRGFRERYGVHGFGHYGEPLPWGTTPEIDAYLTYCGHRKA